MRCIIVIVGILCSNSRVSVFSQEKGRRAMTEEIRKDQIPVDEAVGTDAPQNTQTRRQLLKVLAGTGVAAGMLALPNKWAKPVVEVGVLPVHAQGSQPDVPPYTFDRCSVIGILNDQEIVLGEIYPFSTLQMTAWILPAAAGVELRRTVTLNQVGHPQNGVLHTWEGPTIAGGVCVSDPFDLSSVAPAIIPDVDQVTVTWSFVDPAVGSGVCSRNVTIVEPPN